MTETERDALIGQTLREHKRLKQTLACLSTKADRMQQHVVQALRLIKGETTGHAKGVELYIAERAHSMAVKSCDWPTVEAIGELAAERAEAEKRLGEIETRLRDMGMGDYAG